MQYYKDDQNNIFAYSDIQIPKDGLTKITEQEALELTNPPPTTEQIAAQVRAERDGLIESFRWRIERHNDELALGIEPTEPLEPLLQYVQDLRDVPQQESFPTDISWPEMPAEGEGD